ncbi:MAG: homoserine dehydrogenase [Planctomycetota bacterium]|nr:MAG: homoserine dehydrogenase [Planctomycetota bacterium]
MEIGIGILGYGGIGQGVVKSILDKRDLLENRSGICPVIKKISYRSRKPGPELALPESMLTQNPEDVVTDPDVQVVVELLGGYEPARLLVLKAFENGKHVVTANKAIAAKHLVELMEAASEHKVNFAFEGAVAAAIPIISMIQHSFVAESFEYLYGILNGTTNYILTRMREGMEYGEALSLAQEKGFAEPDPTFDVEGLDSAQKLVILGSLLFNNKISDDIRTVGITKLTQDNISYAADLGYTVKLLAIVKRTEAGLEMRVGPTLIPNEHVLSGVNDEYNGIFLSGDDTRTTMISGLGAGQQPTSSIVVSDIVRIAKRVETGWFVPPVKYFENIPVVDYKDTKSKFFIRYHVMDKAGVLAQIAKILGDNDVSIAGVWQKATVSGVVSLVMTTHEAVHRNVFKAVSEIDGQKNLVQDESLILPIDDIDTYE